MKHLQWRAVKPATEETRFFDGRSSITPSICIMYVCPSQCQGIIVNLITFLVFTNELFEDYNKEIKMIKPLS